MRKHLPLTATHLPLDVEPYSTHSVVVSEASSAHVEKAQVALVEGVEGQLVDETKGIDARDVVPRSCAHTVQSHARIYQNATPSSTSAFAAVAPNGRRGCGECAWEAGGIGSSRRMHGLAAHRHSLAGMSAVLPAAQSRHAADMTLKHFLFWSPPPGG